MRLSGLSLAAVLLFSPIVFAQHTSGGASGSSGSSSSSSASSSSSGGSSHTSSSGGSSYSGGGSSGSHSSGGGYSSGGGSSHSASGGGGHSSSGGSAHSSAGGHGSAGGDRSGNNHASVGTHAPHSEMVPRGSGSRSKDESGSNMVNSTRNSKVGPGSTAMRPIHEPKSGAPGRAVVPEKRTFFSFLRHPFRRPQPKVDARPALYLPRPICPKERCVPSCPVGQVRSRGGCTTPAISVVSSQCSTRAIWNGNACLYGARFLDNCMGLRTALDRQARRVQAAESIRQSACSNGVAQECSETTASWQSEESLRQNLLARYQQCRMQSMATSSAGYGLSVYDSSPWFDSLSFGVDY